MKKTRMLLAIALFIFALNGVWGQNPQYDFYSSIPNYKSISIGFGSNAARSVRYRHEDLGHREDFVKSTGERLGMAIYDDYSVYMEYSNVYERGYPPTEFPLSIIGRGVLLWQNERMVLQLEVTTKSRGGYYTSPNGYQTIHYPDQNNTTTYMYNVYYDASSRQLVFDGKDVIVNTRAEVFFTNKYGNTMQSNNLKYTETISLSGAHRISSEAKSQSELNAQTSDVYGKWQWNDDRSVIYLLPTSNDALLFLIRNEGDLVAWGLRLSSSSSGYKNETAADGTELEYLMITFDGGAEQSFVFKSVVDGDFKELYYVQYDRFLGNLDFDTSILSQIKDKRIMIVNYKQNGSSKTAMFQLEGLEAIYNAITQ